MPLNRSTTLFCLIAMSLSLSVAAEKGEIRALWADSWNEGFLTPDQTDAFLKDAWAGGYNTVIVEVRKTADAYYRSTLEPRATNLAGDYDALDDILTKAKRPPRGKPALNVQAWIVVNRIWVGAQKPPKLDPVHLVNAHPDWLMKNDKGEVCNTAGENHMYQDPAHPGVVEHTAAVVRELVSKYPVDAVHLDYIRYPGRDWGYSEAALARFARATGKTGKPAPGESAWKDWRREQNDLLVRRIAAEARSARPGVVLSAAVVTWGGTHGGRFEETDAYAGALQNWPRWCNEGWMDEIYLMNYKRQERPAHAQDYLDWIELGRRLAGGARVISGQAAYLNPLDGSLAQMRAVRQRQVGLATYCYKNLSSDKTTRATVLGRFARWAAEGPRERPAGPAAVRTMLAGRVVDAAGKGMDGAAVAAQVAGMVRQASTDATGYYAFFGLPAGEVVVRAGAGPSQATTLPPGGSARLDLAMP